MQKYRNKIGKYGEQLAAQFLEKRAYQILERNVKISYQEIDLVAIKSGKTVFIEVKTRCTENYAFGEESMGYKKYNNLKKAIISYSNKHRLDIDSVRFDLITVNIDRNKKTAKIKHYIELF